MKKIDSEFFKLLAEFRTSGDWVYPDQFNEIAASIYGMPVTKAQELYFFYKNITVGKWPWGEDEALTLAKLEKAQQIVNKCLELKPAERQTVLRSYIRPNDRNRIAVYAEHDGEMMIHEFNITEPATYNIINEMMKTSGIKIVGIVPWVDSIDNLDNNGCDNNMHGKKTMHVYDGDIFVLYNSKESNYWNKPQENGVYACVEGAYRRLLYTTGRGYLVKGNEVNIADDGDEDNEDVYTLDSKRFNHHLLTMNHRWKRIGNLNISIEMLKQEPGKKNP